MERLRWPALHLTRQGTRSRHSAGRMALAVADFMADGQVFGMAVAAVAQGLNVFQRRRLGRDVLAAHPARHHAMQLAGHGAVHLDAKVLQTAHAGIFIQKNEFPGRCVLTAAPPLAFELPDAVDMPTIALFKPTKDLP